MSANGITKPEKNAVRGIRVPILQGVLPIGTAQISGEIMAGLTLAALAIPEVMGYTRIAGMPVITGLYTLVLPMALFALFGSSRHLVVGADSATAAMLAAALAGVATIESTEYVALAGCLALMAAGFLILARLMRLGFLADFLSRTVLVGFLTGVGIQVAIGQVAGMLGLPDGSLRRVFEGLREGTQINPHALSLALGVLAVSVGSKFVSKKIPGALIAVAGAIAASWALDLPSHGVRILGEIPGGLPNPGLPAVELSWELFQRLIPAAFAMSIVILAQSAATARAYAARYNESFSENLDLVGLGIANIGAGLTGAFVVNGSPTKTQMVDSAGGRSQLAPLVTSAIVLIVLMFLTRPLAYMPEAALSAVVFLIGLELIDISGMHRIYRERRWEFWVALTTSVVVVFWGVQQGIVLAIVLSLLVHTRHGYRPNNAVIVAAADGHWRTLPVSAPEELLPGLLVYRFTHSMYYANTQLLSDEVLALVANAPTPPVWFCIDADAVDDVDFSAAETLRFIAGVLKERHIRLVFAMVANNVRAELDRSRITQLIGEDAYFDAVGDVVAAYQSIQTKSES